MPPARPGRFLQSVRSALPLVLILLLLAAATHAEAQDRDADGILDSVETVVRSLDASTPDPDTDGGGPGEVRNPGDDGDGAPDGAAAAGRTAQSFPTAKTTEAAPSDKGPVVTARRESQICFGVGMRPWA